MRLATLFAILLPVLIAACQTITPEQQRAIDTQTCSSYGFKRGTTPFADCLMRLDLDRRADRRAQLNDPVIIYGPGYGRYGW